MISEVTATLVGRWDSVADASLKYSGGKIVGFGGFGNMNAYPARLVLQSVSDVTPKEIDFAKNDEATKGEAAPEESAQTNDLNSAIDAAQKAASAMAAGTAKDAAVKATGVYGKPGDHTGVYANYGTPNEATAKDEELGTKDSPDGVLFNCTFNSDRLQGDALTRAVVHMGLHVSELRNPAPGREGASAYLLENNAWLETAVSAFVAGQRFLTLPGGYLLWDANWPAGNRGENMEAALKDFLANEALLSQ